MMVANLYNGYTLRSLYIRSLLYYIKPKITLTFIEGWEVKDYASKLHNSLGIFLPLIAVNCAILGASLLMYERGYNFVESCVYGVSTGAGWAMAIITMASIRFRLKYSNVPLGLRGIGITMILTGLISMAYMSFSGINL